MRSPRSATAEKPKEQQDPAQPKTNKLHGIIFKKDPTYHNELFYVCVCVGPARQSFPTNDWTQAIAGEDPNPNHEANRELPPK